MQPGHVAAGLGGASREFLTVCLGVFDDSSLLKRLEGVLWNTVSKWTPLGHLVLSESVATNAEKWDSGEELSDDHLRAILWIRLQRALDVCPSITRSIRGCERLVGDLVAAGLKGVDAGASKGLGGRALEQATRLWRGKEGQSESDTRPNTLAALVEPLLSTMVQRALADGDDAMDEESKERLVVDIVAELGEDERRTILDEVGEEEIDRAVWRLLTTGGIHGTFGATVATAGFALYILAAQASAFIPFVSGPALVSLVSVLANPVVVVAAVVGLGWYWNRKANEKAAAQVAIHVIALLACDGLGRGREALEKLVGSFRRIPGLGGDAFIDGQEEWTYKALWHDLEASSWLTGPESRPALADHWERNDLSRGSLTIGHYLLR